MHRRFLILFAGAVWCAAAAKQPKVAKSPAAPIHGVKTPGVLIPFETLKSEAVITLASPPAALLFTESIALADTAGIHRYDSKTNAPFDPPRDLAGLDKPCGGMLSAFSFVWMPVCGKPALAKLDMRPVPAPPQPTEKAKADDKVVAGETKKPEDAKPEEKKASGERRSRGPRNDTPPAAPAFLELASAPSAPAAIAATEDSIWLLADEKTSLQRIDPKENRIVAEVRLPPSCTSLLAAERSLWIACPSESKLLRVNPRTNLVEKRIDVAAEPVSVTAGESSIWVLSRKEGKVARIDPKTNKVTATIDLAVPNADGALAFGDGMVWASLPGFPVIRIAPATDKVVQQFHGDGGGRIHFGLNSLWVASAGVNRVIRFDPKRVLATLAE